jgi:hypothetical protein
LEDGKNRGKTVEKRPLFDGFYSVVEGLPDGSGYPADAVVAGLVAE